LSGAAGILLELLLKLFLKLFLSSLLQWPYFQAGIFASRAMQKYQPVSFWFYSPSLDSASVPAFPAPAAVAPVKLQSFPHTSRFPRTALSFCSDFYVCGTDSANVFWLLPLLA